jgi:hypothetical protein
MNSSAQALHDFPRRLEGKLADLAAELLAGFAKCGAQHIGRRTRGGR